MSGKLEPEWKMLILRYGSHINQRKSSEQNPPGDMDCGFIERHGEKRKYHHVAPLTRTICCSKL
ncbi:hypothetical protein ColLi_04357 [Colletotrichum liriopes]|uniref:Uncharacterized protein n=1 Tax=Colletotrichum liriopes TaxID=708192 RepID=A0AA37LQT8_9PEZI|nr:hypothetical protein ColLi_04357 [Colletotrichum liriopes]